MSDEEMFPRPLVDALGRDPERTGMEHGDRLVSCGEMLSLIARAAGGMRSAGLGPGSGLAVQTGLTPEAFAANVAAHAVGCMVVGIKPGWGGPQIAALMGQGIDAVLVDASPAAADLVAEAGSAAVLTLGADPHPNAIDLLAAPDPHPGELPLEAQADDIARLNFTSGSTGEPKGCMRTYQTFSLDFQADRWAPDLARLVELGDRYLMFRSLAVPVILTFAARCLMTGGTVVISDDPGLGFAQVIERHAVSGLALTVPDLHALLADLRDEPRDLGCLRALVVTGSPASPGLLGAATEQLGPVVWQGYGQAESGMISLLTPDDIEAHPAVALGSVGRPLPEVELSIRDDGGRELGPGQAGEVCVRSPHMMAGYWRDPEQTRAVLRDGWLLTRDVGFLDPSGLLHLTGRSRDVIIVNAEVCYAGAIERVLAKHPAIEQAYVVGVPDTRTGESVHAFVVPEAADGSASRQPQERVHPEADQHPTSGRHEWAMPAAGPGVASGWEAGVVAGAGTGDTPIHDALAALVRAELTPNHVPATVTVIAHVPVAASGKPDKQALADEARSRVGRPRYRSIMSDSALWDGFVFRDGDIVIGPPSKSGTTWLQMLCALLIFDTTELDRPLTSISPWVDCVATDRATTLATLDAQQHRRFVKTHIPLDGLPFDERVTYICVGRDPRDVMLSAGAANRNLSPEVFDAARQASGLSRDALQRPADDLLERFWRWADGERRPDQRGIGGSLANVVHHLGTYWDRRHEPQIVLFHYSDLLADLPGQLRRLAQALAIDAADERIDQLAEAATFERMRARADDLAPGVDHGFWRDNHSFFRSGTSGQWRDLLDPAAVARYERRVTELAPPDLATWLHDAW